MGQLRARQAPIRLTWDAAEESTDLSIPMVEHDFDAPLTRTRKFGFVQQLRSLTGSLFFVFAILGLIGLLLGLAIFYLGVVLPFGLA